MQPLQLRHGAGLLCPVGPGVSPARLAGSHRPDEEFDNPDATRYRDRVIRPSPTGIELTRRPRFGSADRTAFGIYLRDQGTSAVVVKRRDADALDIFSTSLYSTRTYWANCFRARGSDGAPFRVFPGYVAAPGLNAFADLTGDLHVCGINAGLVFAIFELSCFCLAQADVLTEVGNASEETSPVATEGPPGFSLPTRLAFHRGEPKVAGPVVYYPNHPQRQAAAWYLALLMMRFVWFHELYHCLNGHVRFVQGQGLALRIDEEPIDLDRLTCRTLRALELDADQSAFFICATLQKNGTENIYGIRALPEGLRLKLTLLGAYLTTWMFDEQHRRTGQSSFDTHPAPYLRMHNILRCAAAYLDDDAFGLARMNREVLSDIDHLAPLVGSNFNADRFIGDMQSESFQAELDDYDSLNARLAISYRQLGYR